MFLGAVVSSATDQECSVEFRSYPNFEEDIRHIHEETAGTLAADRQTKSLPAVFAEAFFIGGCS